MNLNSQTPAPEASSQRQAMTRRYRWQTPFFDLTRRPVLLGRQWLAAQLRPASRLIEVGCGTGANLIALQRAAGRDSHVLGIECAATMAQRARAHTRHLAPSIEIAECEFGVEPSGHADALVFCYSLSMIPDYLTALERAMDTLPPGGQILVLDFVDSAWAPLRWLMRHMGVALGEARWTALRQRFKVRHEVEHRAYGGLWRYRLLVGERDQSR